MINSSLKQLAAAIKTKKISSRELTQSYLSRIETLNPELNAFITVDAEKSLACRCSDKLLEAGQAGINRHPRGAEGYFLRPLAYHLRLEMLGNFIAPYDAQVIERFNAAGAVNPRPI